MSKILTKTDAEKKVYRLTETAIEIKRQKKEFPYMTKPRAELKAQLREKYRVTA